MLRFLETERLVLRPLEPADAEGPYAQWLNDAEVCRGNSHHVFPYTRQQGADYIRQMAGSNQSIVLGIVWKADSAHVGNIALQNIQWLHRTAEFAILLGDSAYWQRGIGKEAGAALVRHGFETLGLNRIYCGTFAGNHGMQRLATALGMKQEGVRREAVFKNGHYTDVLEYGVLRSEWQG
ncbi:GNAT family N-acetyltransferase [bacterium]|nr:GNAT family N-acetyltransferase [bacterium]